LISMDCRVNPGSDEIQRNGPACESFSHFSLSLRFSPAASNAASFP
jgi:hypothetical protein